MVLRVVMRAYTGGSSINLHVLQFRQRVFENMWTWSVSFRRTNGDIANVHMLKKLCKIVHTARLPSVGDCKRRCLHFAFMQ